MRDDGAERVPEAATVVVCAVLWCVGVLLALFW